MQAIDFLQAQPWLAHLHKHEMLQLQKRYTFHAILEEALLCMQLDKRVLAFAVDRSGEGQGQADPTQLHLRALLCLQKQQQQKPVVEAGPESKDETETDQGQKNRAHVHVDGSTSTSTGTGTGTDAPALLLQICGEYYLVDHTAFRSISAPVSPSTDEDTGVDTRNCKIGMSEPPSVFITLSGVSMRWWCAQGSEGQGQGQGQDQGQENQVLAHTRLTAAVRAINTHLLPFVLGRAQAVRAVLPMSDSDIASVSKVKKEAAASETSETSDVPVQVHVRQLVRECLQNWLALASRADGALVDKVSTASFAASLFSPPCGGGGAEAYTDNQFPRSTRRAFVYRADEDGLEDEQSGSRVSMSTGAGAGALGKSNNANNFHSVPLAHAEDITSIAKMCQVRKEKNKAGSTLTPSEAASEVQVALVGCRKAKIIHAELQRCLSGSKRKIDVLIRGLHASAPTSENNSLDAGVDPSTGLSSSPVTLVSIPAKIQEDVQNMREMLECSAVFESLPRCQYFYE